MMCQCKNFLILILFIYIGRGQFVYAQVDDCSVYASTLKYIIQDFESTQYLYRPTIGGIDPTDTFLGYKEEVQWMRSLDFYIVSDVRDFRSHHIRAFSELVGDTALVEGNYILGKDSVITDCELIGIQKYRYVELTEVLNFDEDDSFIEVHGADTVYVNPARIVFSNILYSDSGLALLYANVKIGSTGGSGRIYGFVLENKGGNWITKAVGTILD